MSQVATRPFPDFHRNLVGSSEHPLPVPIAEQSPPQLDRESYEYPRHRGDIDQVKFKQEPRELEVHVDDHSRDTTTHDKIHKHLSPISHLAEASNPAFQHNHHMQPLYRTAHGSYLQQYSDMMEQRGMKGTAHPSGVIIPEDFSRGAPPDRSPLHSPDADHASRRERSPSRDRSPPRERSPRDDSPDNGTLATPRGTNDSGSSSGGDLDMYGGGGGHTFNSNRDNIRG